MKCRLIICLVVLNFMGSLHGAVAAAPREEVKALSEPISEQKAAHGLLVFLDDSEKTLDAISQSLLSAIEHEDGPIIASASLLVNIHRSKLNEGFRRFAPKDLAALYQEISTNRKKAEPYSLPSKAEKNILLFLTEFDAEKAKNWIIKMIKPSLYLLWPKKYLKEKGIDGSLVENYDAASPITPLELSLGLRVNHMETVSIADIRLPAPVPLHADYFIDALNTIFILNHEYPADHKNSIAPWAIFIAGHGAMGDSIVGLSIEQFKLFLNFLDTKIRTRALIYLSCYAAGINADLIYKDALKGVARTYSFTIISLVLTDIVSRVPFGVYAVINRDIIEPKFQQDFSRFLQEITAPEVVDYRKAMEQFYGVGWKFIGNDPRIKYSGLPWFSVLDDANKFISIDSILAKSRKAPLDIGTFFGKRGGKAAMYNIMGILLYAHDVPFDLIITHGITAYPGFISMIPGEAIHHLKKIITFGNVDQVMNSFFIQDLAPTKLYVIDELEGYFSSAWGKILGEDERGTLKGVYIKVSGDKKINTIHFVSKGKIYKVEGNLDSDDFNIKKLPAEVANVKDYLELWHAFEADQRSRDLVGGETKDSFERRSTHELLTSEAIGHIQEVQEKKIKEVMEKAAASKAGSAAAAASGE